MIVSNGLTLDDSSANESEIFRTFRNISELVQILRAKYLEHFGTFRIASNKYSSLDRYRCRSQMNMHDMDMI